MPVKRALSPVVREGENERLLVEAAQTDPVKFGDLYEIHFERIYAFVVRRVRDRNIAEDLTADVFHKALANLRKYDWRGAPFAAWLIRIAANALADHFKREDREVVGSAIPLETDVQPDLAAIDDEARLSRCVSLLPKDQRHVIFERFVEQKSIREIAEQLGRTEGAVKQLQLRALKNLRTHMGAGHA